MKYIAQDLGYLPLENARRIFEGKYAMIEHANSRRIVFVTAMTWGLQAVFVLFTKSGERIAVWDFDNLTTDVQFGRRPRPATRRPSRRR